MKVFHIWLLDQPPLILNNQTHSKLNHSILLKHSIWWYKYRNWNYYGV